MSRQEKVLASLLTARGIACYLPLRLHVRRRANRRSEALLPLFPGYVFLWGSVDEVYEADRTRRVAQVIPVGDQQILEWELRNLDRALCVQAPLDPYDTLLVGLRARVVAGPFAGLEGLVASRAVMDRVVLQVRILGTAVSLEVPCDAVEVTEQ